MANSLESAESKRWLDWCQKKPLVKCTAYDVPDGILPKDYKGVLTDVKVQGKGFMPDDLIYSNHEDLRLKVARGNSVLELHRVSKGVIQETQYMFLVFALKKFSGGMGDEDDVKSCAQNMWQLYFIKPLTEASKIVCTVKANGEAAHVSCRRIEDTDIYCFGSKNVHLLARNSGDFDKYKDSRFMVAKEVGKAFFRCTMESDSFSEKQKHNLFSYMSDHKYTLVAELLQPGYQHVENLSHLKQPLLQFICWTEPYKDENCDNLCAVPPDQGIEQARSLGLDTVDYTVIPVSAADEFMTKVRGEKDYEGRVMYFLDENQNVLGVLKKKTSWYIILRAIREKTCHACNPKSNVSSQDIHKKISKRIDEIQTWLGFSNQYNHAWKRLGIAFAEWAVKTNKKTAENVKLGVRAKFPVLWKTFLDNHEELKDVYDNLDYS